MRWEKAEVEINFSLQLWEKIKNFGKNMLTTERLFDII